MQREQKTRIAVLFGGQSAEHEISLLSAKNVIAALDPAKYEITLIGIDRSGRWQLNSDAAFLLNNAGKALPNFSGTAQTALSVVPGGKSLRLVGGGEERGCDVVFPVLHGPFGEDGTVQGLLKLAGLPFVGADVLGSAVGMDKDVSKRLLKEAGLPQARFLVLRRSEHKGQDKKAAFAAVSAELGLPLFIKPANMGSSVGVSKVSSAAEWQKALDLAFLYDDKVVVEEAIARAREIEVAVLGDDDELLVSLPGEIEVHADFYSYEAKYLDEKGASLHIPAELRPEQIAAVQELAKASFRTLCCEGMARVDCFLTEDGRFLVNEINTIPGFTQISMYPKLFEHSGISYGELLERLIGLAIKRHAAKQALKLNF